MDNRFGRLGVGCDDNRRTGGIPRGHDTGADTDLLVDGGLSAATDGIGCPAAFYHADGADLSFSVSLPRSRDPGVRFCDSCVQGGSAELYPANSRRGSTRCIPAGSRVVRVYDTLARRRSVDRTGIRRGSLPSTRRDIAGHRDYGSAGRWCTVGKLRGRRRSSVRYVATLTLLNMESACARRRIGGRVPPVLLKR
jgi:hypothetical protein